MPSRATLRKSSAALIRPGSTTSKKSGRRATSRLLVRSTAASRQANAWAECVGEGATPAFVGDGIGVGRN